MANYRVNKNVDTNSRGDNEVHQESCIHYYQLLNFEYLGNFSNCAGAVQEAKNRGYKADGCRKCCPSCHNG